MFRGRDNDDTNRGRLALMTLLAKRAHGGLWTLSVREVWLGGSNYTHPGGPDPGVLLTGDGGDGGVGQQTEQRDDQPVDHQQQHVVLARSVTRLKQTEGHCHQG